MPYSLITENQCGGVEAIIKVIHIKASVSRVGGHDAFLYGFHVVQYDTCITVGGDSNGGFGIGVYNKTRRPAEM